MKSKRDEIAGFLATIGVAMLIATYIRYTLQGGLQGFTKIILIAGCVFLLAALVLGFGYVLRFFSRRSSQLGTNTLILALAVLAILAVLNYLGYRHHKRFDLTSEKLFTLSDQTQQIVHGLSRDVTIVRFSDHPDREFDELLGGYRALSSHFHFEEVDPREKPEVAKEYGAKKMGDVFVASGDRTQRLDPGVSGHFEEQTITDAILKVTRDTAQTVCFVSGHGEHSLSDKGESGYTLLDQGLRDEGYATKDAALTTGDSVPSACNVLAIAGPTQPFLPVEAAMVAKYLDGGGRVFILVDPETDPKLGDIFDSWNVKLGANLVIDNSAAARASGIGPTNPIVTSYGTSPITDKLQGFITIFPMARTVSIADAQKPDPQMTELIKTSENSFTIPKLPVPAKGQDRIELRFDPKTDQRGPLSLGVSAERQSGSTDSRLVVIGNSAFATNPYVGFQRNGDLFYNSVDWLAHQESLISIRPKSPANRRVTLTQAQSIFLKWFDLLILPGIVIIAGVAIWWKRR